jgi:GGDEF domain-containing protein
MNIARLKIAEARLDLPYTLLTAAIAGYAAIGIAFLLSLSTTVSPSPAVTVLGLGTLFALFLVLVTDRSTIRAKHDAEAEAISDPSSGLIPPPLGRRMLSVAFSAAERGQALTIVMFSIDGMASYRTIQGQAAANGALRCAGRVLNAHTRGMHISSRYQGEAVFLSVLTGVGLEGARIFAQRVRQDYAKRRDPGDLRALSAGIVTYESSIRSVDRLLEQAQRALNRATVAGDSVVVMEPAALTIGDGREPAAAGEKGAELGAGAPRRW